MIRFRRVALVALLAILAALTAPATTASAHPIGASAVYLTVRTDQVGVELDVPLDKLNQATGLLLEGSAASVQANEPALRALLAASLSLTDGSRQPYDVEIARLDTREVNGSRALVAELTAAPENGPIVGDLTLGYSLVLDRLAGHRAFVFLVSDLEAGQVAEGGPRAIGSLAAGSEHLDVPRSGASWWTGFVAMAGLGARHIAEGTDHILFLITLLLVAPLFARGGRWAGRRRPRSALLRTLGIVTSFTAGHTTSLALVSFGLVRFPERPVEVLVAFSIMVAAIHALHPLTSRGEIVVGGVFGLVHGTAFATAILELGLDTRATVVAVLGFNAGVELAQLVVVALVLPVLMLLATRGFYRWIRRAVAVFSVTASACWIGAIVTDGQTVLQPLFDLLAGSPPLAYALLASTAVGAWAATRPVTPRGEPDEPPAVAEETPIPAG